MSAYWNTLFQGDFDTQTPLSVFGPSNQETYDQVIERFAAGDGTLIVDLIKAKEYATAIDWLQAMGFTSPDTEARYSTLSDIINAARKVSPEFLEDVLTMTKPSFEKAGIIRRRRGHPIRLRGNLYDRHPLVNALHDMDEESFDIIRSYIASPESPHLRIYHESLERCDLLVAKYFRRVFEIKPTNQELFSATRSGCSEAVEYVETYYPGWYTEEHVDELVSNALFFHAYDWLNSLFALFGPLINHENTLKYARNQEDRHIVEELIKLYPHY